MGGQESSGKRHLTIVAVYDNHRPNTGPFLRGPLLENGTDSYWVTIGFQLTPGSEHVPMRYPSDDVTVVPIGTTSDKEDSYSSILLGFSRLEDADQD